MVGGGWRKRWRKRPGGKSVGEGAGAFALGGDRFVEVGGKQHRGIPGGDEGEAITNRVVAAEIHHFLDARVASGDLAMVCASSPTVGGQRLRGGKTRLIRLIRWPSSARKLRQWNASSRAIPSGIRRGRR